MGQIHLERRLHYAAAAVRARLAADPGIHHVHPLLADRVTLGVRPLGARDSEVFAEADCAARFGFLGRIAGFLFLNALLKLTLRLMLRKLDMSLCDSTANCP